MANIVIAQTFQDDLDRIREHVRPDCRNRISYFDEPANVLKEVALNPVDIVVTGEVFYHTDLNTIENLLGAMIDGSVFAHFMPKCIHSGPELAFAVRAIKPDLMILRYSRTPDTNPIEAGFVGDIPKPMGSYSAGNPIVDFVSCNELSDLLAVKDWKRMGERFPEIRFYSNLEGLK